MRRQKYYYVGGKSRLSRINLGTYILTNDKLEFRQAPDFYDDNHFDWPFTVDPERKKRMHTNLKFVEGLLNVSEFHSKVLHIAITLDRYLVSPDEFTFRDFWSNICEPLFPNDHKGFIAFCKQCFRIYLHRKFQTRVKIFLSNSLKESSSGYSLPAKVFRHLGLDIEMLRPISAKTFSKQYSKIGDHLKFEFLSDILSEIDKYSLNPNTYFTELDNWLDNMLHESYAERNLEVHNNITTDLSLMKLRQDCLEIGNIMLLVISERIRKRTRSLASLGI